MKYVLDTSAYSELVRGHVDIASLVLNAEELLLPQFSVAELQYGFSLGNRHVENEKILMRFLNSSKVRLIFADNVTTDHYVELAVYVHKSGKQLSHHDLWIAALAAQYKATIVTFDGDFRYVPKHAPEVILLTTVKK